MTEPVHALLAIFTIAFLTLVLTVFGDFATRGLRAPQTACEPEPIQMDLYGGYGRHASAQGRWGLDKFLDVWTQMTEDQKDEYCQEFTTDRVSTPAY